jgi:hypothetical protein
MKEKITRHVDPEASEGETSPPHLRLPARGILRCTQDDGVVRDEGGLV